MRARMPSGRSLKSKEIPNWGRAGFIGSYVGRHFVNIQYCNNYMWGYMKVYKAIWRYIQVYESIMKVYKHI
jgi:hypothetical protein